MIKIEHLAKHAGTKLLFDDVNLNLNDGSRYGVVGANGSGKSTFLRLIAEEEEASLGTITPSKGSTLGWLKQDQYLFENEPILDVVLRGKPRLWQALQEKNTLLSGEEWTDRIAMRVAALEEIIEQEGGYAADALAHSLLTGLGIEEEKHENPLSTLSGGFKLRVLLARALFNNPDVLLLDEPTNYLDIVSIQWLEGYLTSRFKGLLLIVSHDQDFLNKVCTHILDIDYGDIRLYNGNYDQFMRQKEAIAEQRELEKKNLEKRVARLRLFIERFRASASRSKQALSREKQVDKLEWPEIEDSSRRAPHFAFQHARASAEIPLKAEALSKHYGAHQLFKDVNLTLKRGEKLVILGPNGVGKSTFLKVLLQEVGADNGEFAWGQNTSIAYFAQNHRDLMQADLTALDWLQGEHSYTSEEKLRGMLAQVLFPKEDVFKRIEALSGGEVSRLLIASMMLKKANVLILDEPTNHLDLEGREALAHALQKFDGTLLLVSHDRHFFSQVATRLLLLSHGSWKDFRGTYQDYQG